MKEVKMGVREERRQTEICWRESGREGLGILAVFLFVQKGEGLGTCSGIGPPELTLAPQQLPDHPSNNPVRPYLILGA